MPDRSRKALLIFQVAAEALLGLGLLVNALRHRWPLAICYGVAVALVLLYHAIIKPRLLRVRDTQKAHRDA